SVPRQRRGTPAPEQVQDAHAALRPNNLPNKRWCSVGMLIGTTSPLSRRAALRYARAGALVALHSVTGEPTLDARNTSWLSGIIPSNGIGSISRTSSILSISP